VGVQVDETGQCDQPVRVDDLRVVVGAVGDEPVLHEQVDRILAVGPDSLEKHGARRRWFARKLAHATSSSCASK
jgi:hypothetical protein